MRALFVLVPLLLAAPALAATHDGSLLVRYHFDTGAVSIAPPDPAEILFELDACTTASPAVTSCTGALGPHAPKAAPENYVQALLYPREIVSVEGGTFDIVVAWESGDAGVRCAVPPTTGDPAALLGIACEEIGAIPSFAWLSETWSLQGHQSESVLGAIQFTVVFDGSI